MVIILVNMVLSYKSLLFIDTEFECTLTVSSVHSDLLQYCSISGQRECTSLTTLLSKEDHQGVFLLFYFSYYRLLLFLYLLFLNQLLNVYLL